MRLFCDYQETIPHLSKLSEAGHPLGHFRFFSSEERDWGGRSSEYYFKK